MTAAQIWGAFHGFDYRVVFDILAVAWLIYRLLLLAKGTRAWQVTAGLAIFFLAVFLSDRFQFHSLNWLLRQAFPLGPVAIVILFLPELRHTLEEFGRPGFWGRSLGLVAKEEMRDMVDAVVAAVATLAVKRIGALIVFEREVGLGEVIATGTPMDAVVTSQLLGTIFHNGTPLHDGAVILREDRLVSAGCTLPLTASPRVDATVHTRHKAAMGMTEVSDSIVVVVSEETGTVSLALEGKLIRGLRTDALRTQLYELLQIGAPHGLASTPIGQVASRVGDAIKTTRTRGRQTSAKARPRAAAPTGAASPQEAE